MRLKFKGNDSTPTHKPTQTSKKLKKLIQKNSED